MSFIIVGNCPKCGAPIYAEQFWMGILPPPSIHSCNCFPRAATAWTTTTTINAAIKEKKGEENV